MEASSAVVIKVKYGDMLRRFNAPIVDEKLLLDVNGLREKIISLFSFALDTDLMLTYVDEDGDVVALVDDDDLLDVAKQGLNPLRVTVKLNDDKNGNPNYSIASLTPLRSPRAQRLPNLSAGVSEIVRKVPEPLRETLLKLSDDLASKASSTSPNISEIVDSLSKVTLSFLGQLSESGVKLNMQNHVPKSSSAAGSTASEALNVDTAANVERNEVKVQTVTGQTKECPSFDFNAVAAALGSQDANVPKPESGSVYHNALRKEKVKKAVESSNGMSHVGKVAEFCVSSNNIPSFVDNKLTQNDIYHYNEPKVGPNPTSDGSSNYVNGDHVTERAKSALLGAFDNAPVPIWSPYKNAFLGSFHRPRPMYECPFSGTSFENISTGPPHPASDAVPFRRSYSQNDSNANTFHRGVRCDGCGIHPIVGPRFNSRVKVDYDLCRVCFEKMGNENDYIRMDRPVHRHHLPHFRPAMSPHVHRGIKGKLGTLKLDSRFIQDVNIFDETVMAPLTPFTKIWRMRNNSTAAWPQKTQLVWIEGDKLTDTCSVEVQIPAGGLLMDQELDVAIDFISPEHPGRYISYWRLASPSGQRFGQRIWVAIQVDASMNETSQKNVGNLNLNLPPPEITGPQIINVDPEPVVESRRRKTGKLKKIVESGPPNTENELKFPINDSLLVGSGSGSSSTGPSSSSTVQYPIIDLTDVVPNLSSVLFPMPTPPPPTAPDAMSTKPAAELPANHVEEDRLLKELEEMGFKQVDLNKEVLRMNEYDLEQSVDDLCGVAEWDPMLEELEEMGFHDTEMNKLLLKKNNGSIKRVVMDLIAGEQV